MYNRKINNELHNKVQVLLFLIYGENNADFNDFDDDILSIKNTGCHKTQQYPKKAKDGKSR